MSMKFVEIWLKLRSPILILILGNPFKPCSRRNDQLLNFCLFVSAVAGTPGTRRSGKSGFV